mmetsp:Transcript_56265/g.134095  ORF Transcript_56265/g.134095 Transcript_56265/m.134095 type:complete len:99 (-) Transcript_56265:799-1095(-)
MASLGSACKSGCCAGNSSGAGSNGCSGCECLLALDDKEKCRSAAETKKQQLTQRSQRARERQTSCWQFDAERIMWHPSPGRRALQSYGVFPSQHSVLA